MRKRSCEHAVRYQATYTVLSCAGANPSHLSDRGQQKRGHSTHALLTPSACAIATMSLLASGSSVLSFAALRRRHMKKQTTAPTSRAAAGACDSRRACMLLLHAGPTVVEHPCTKHCNAV